MALKPKHKGEDPNDMRTELVEDPDALVSAKTGKESNDIGEELIQSKEYKSRHKEHR